MSRRFLASLMILLLPVGLVVLLSVAATQWISHSDATSQVKSGPSAPQGTWVAIATFPSMSLSPTPGTNPLQVKRAAAVAYPPTGKIYLMGGRTGMDGDDYNLNGIMEYAPGNPGTWTVKNARLGISELQNQIFTANMAAGVLSDSTGARIYAVGGINIESIETAAVRAYNPISDTSTTISTDPWPITSTLHIPGGYAVYQNKLYVFGGFTYRDLGGVFGDTWRFDPAAAAGHKWTSMKQLNLPRGYMASAVVDGKLYAIGGDTWQTATQQLVPVADVEMMDLTQANPAWVEVAPLPTARGDLGAWAYDSGTGNELSGKIAVAGGHYEQPNDQAYLYDPTSNSWSAFANFLYPTRNYAPAQLNGILYAFGGYDYSEGLPNGANFNQRYDAGGGPGGTPTPTTTTSTATPPTPTACAVQFSDVPVGSTFYSYIRCLSCRGIVSGYGDGTFRPDNNITRGQLAKIVSNAASLNDPQTTQLFQDVPAGSTFFDYIGRLASRGTMSGYPCGGPGEQCVPPGNRPYFRPNTNATRGQISKIDANTAGFSDTPTGQQFEDVPPGSAFYTYTYRLVSRNIMSGYPCGGAGEPCNPPGNRPYFRPNSNATRGQTSKVVANTFFPNCQTP